MPRKGRHKLYDEDDYDYYDDYKDDDEFDYAEHGQSRKEDDATSSAPQQNFLGGASKAGETALGEANLWRCSICTYDNPEDYLACDICGVIRHPSTRVDQLSTAVPFKFDGPSPDDKVLAGKQRNARSVPVEVSSPSILSKTSLSTMETKGGVNTSHSSKLKATLESKAPARSRKLGYDKEKKIESCHVIKPSQYEGESYLDDGMKHMSLDNNLQDNGIINHKIEQSSNKGLPLDNYKPEQWMLEDNENEKKLFHLVIVGHVDAGKSTLMGRILHLLGRISQKEMHKHRKEANEMGKGSFAYAWALDEGSEERARGVTMTVAMKHFETKKFKVVLLDAPGHKDFIPNMISGAAQADAAVLVVDASTGAFEAGFEGQGQVGGQTREHAQLVKSLGVNQLVVAVNKMDAVNYSKSRFNQIKGSLAPFLKQCGFKDTAILWVPVSGIEAQNLVTGPSETQLTSWYTGINLLDAIDTLEPPVRLTSKPLRLIVAEVFSKITLGPTAVSGKLESGAVKVGTKVLLMPSREIARVKSLEQDGESVSVGRAGDHLDVGLQGVDAGALMVGGVLCHPDYPVPIATLLELKVLTLGITVPLLRGTQVVLHAHHAKDPARIAELVSLLDLKTGAVIRQSPRCLTANQRAVIQVVPERGVCVEEYTNFRSLGRIILRDGGKTVAVGVISRIISQQ
ncbi:hypothetical protein O6H91_16G077400 [Diphasiastrum complanatum]|uniref:Uncharacterized protein n=1 Tax=Diphasiastrum complanatum TaxID=34168 RepID=A0ACC2BE61_DIPCM|nr:hypothetical protein O6H91_16G077400 [Diphasiastrum complanatum]